MSNLYTYQGQSFGITVYRLTFIGIHTRKISVLCSLSHTYIYRSIESLTDKPNVSKQQTTFTLGILFFFIYLFFYLLNARQCLQGLRA